MTAHPDGSVAQRSLPRCGTAPGDCWQLVPDAWCDRYAGPPLRVDVVRASEPPPSTGTLFECGQPCPQTDPTCS